jgi:hypothetical protein
MNAFAEFLEPADRFVPGILTGKYGLNTPSQRVTDPDTGRFVAALVPGDGLQRRLSTLSLNVSDATATLTASESVSALLPMLQAMQIINTVGCLASVANLGVSCVGFALVLQRLTRIEGKLDEMLTKVDVLQQSVRQLQGHADALSLARVRAAGDCLDRAVSASTPAKREELATHARDLFQESRALYLELWRAARPWHQLAVPVQTALEIQSRYVVCAIGEIQAEFIGGDMGTFRHAVGSVVEDFKVHMSLNGPIALRSRSDAACTQTDVLARFGLTLVDLTAQLRVANDVTQWTAERLEGFALDADLPSELGLEPHEIVGVVRLAKGDGLYALRRPPAA